MFPPYPASTGSGSSSHRKHVGLFGSHTAFQGIEVDALNSLRPATRNDVKLRTHRRCKPGPDLSEALVEATRPPFLCALANLIGREEPCGLCASKNVVAACRVLMCEADAAAILHHIAEVLMQPRANVGTPRHIDIGNRFFGRERIDLVVDHNLVVAAE